MSEMRAQYDEEFKKNAVKFRHASPKSVKQVADDLGIGENLLYDGGRSTPLTATRPGGLRWMKRTRRCGYSLHRRAKPKSSE